MRRNVEFNDSQKHVRRNVEFNEFNDTHGVHVRRNVEFNDSQQRVRRNVEFNDSQQRTLDAEAKQSLRK